jgi:hypothetical protein
MSRLPIQDSTFTGNITTVDTAQAVIGFGSVSTIVPSATTSYVELEVIHHSTVFITATGTWTGSPVLEATSDNLNWFTIVGSKVGSVTAASQFSFTTPTFMRCNIAGYKKFRVRAPLGSFSALTSIRIFLRATAFESVITTELLQVSGGAGNNGAPSGNPVLIAGLDYTNNKVRTIATGAEGILITRTLPEAIAQGLVTGSKYDTRDGNVTTTGSVAEVLIQNTAYTEQTSNAQRSIRSSNAADAAAGTGIRTVRLTYYSLAAGVITGPFAEDLTMNGVTAVATVSTTICYIEKIQALTVGSTGAAVGNIELLASHPAGAVIASILAGQKETKYTRHYVATGEYCYLTNVLCVTTFTAANETTIFGRTRNPASSISPNLEIIDGLIVVGDTTTSEFTWNRPKVIIGPSVITFSAVPSSTAANSTRLSFDYYEL